MEEIYNDSYFDNIQLIKLVSSAETLLQHLYELVSCENKQFIDQWLCCKQEFDACSSTKFDLNLEKNGDLINDETLAADAELSELDNYSCEESYSSHESSSSIEETADEHDQIVTSGFESGSQMLDEYSKNFKIYTESIMSGWFSNLNLDPVENSCGDSPNPNSSIIGRLRAYQPNFPKIMSQDNEISSLRFCHCCANETVNCYSILLLPMEEQVSYLRDIKTPLIQACEKITNHVKKYDTDKELITLQEVLELLDISIEIKNYQHMADHEIENFIQTNHLVYSSVLNCLKMLSSSELHYVFICFLNKLAILRENSSSLDKLILKLDNTIVDKEIRLKYLNENYIKLRDTCALFRNKSKPLPSKGPDNNKLEAIINAHRNSSLPKTSNVEPSIANKDESSPPSFLRNIPNSSIRILQHNKLSKRFGVKKQGNKLLIDENLSS